MPTTPDPQPRVREHGTRAILDRFGQGDPAQILRLDELLSGLGKRAFGMLLFVSALPAFIPIPGGGAIAGPLMLLIGLQLLVGLRRPWLPGFLARRGPRREAMARFDRRLSPWLARLEHLIRPRMTWVLDHRAMSVLTGLLLVLLGALTTLPLPFTNFLFGALALAFALALLERDGALMLLAWLATGIAVAVSGVLSGTLVAEALHWLQSLGIS
ncbi:MAG: exopolysaccharide biosynthesis protein [Thermomonas sp.]